MKPAFFFFFFSLVGGREKSLVISDWRLFRVRRDLCCTVLGNICVPTHKLSDGSRNPAATTSQFRWWSWLFLEPPCSLVAADVPALHCEQYGIQMLLGKKKCVIGMLPSLVELFRTHGIFSVPDSINCQHCKNNVKGKTRLRMESSGGS